MAIVLKQNYEIVDVDRLIVHPDNPNRGDLSAISTSIATNGFFGAVLARRSTREVLAGNWRLEAAKREGLNSLPVIWVDCTDSEARRILLADNRTRDLATYDEEALAQILTEARSAEGGLDGTGFNQSDLDELILSAGDALLDGDGDQAPEARVDVAEELLRVWNVTKGQVWEIPSLRQSGQIHRLMCGDSTSKPDVEKLLAGHQPVLMATDPPYGVKYDSTWREEFSGGEYSSGAIANDDRADWGEVWSLWGASILYIWHGGLHAGIVAKSIVDAGFQIRAQIIWNKSVMVFGRGAYHWKHEPCWYAVAKGAIANWQGDRSQTTVWDCGNGSGAGKTGDELDEYHAGHISQKPVELFRKPIRNHTRPGDFVVEPFAGSGSQFVAAEQLGRLCFGMEFEPKFVAVILDRLSRMGLEPKLVNV